ncbi:MAG: C39 family peptidase [Fimbriimonadaceae bacterium]|nr:C39 family peptidase [Alphaproteobacteria bacterium]
MNRLLLLFLIALIAGSPTSVSSKALAIPPAIQQADVWCWVAVIEMVMKYYDVPNVNRAGNYQCGIVGALSFGTSAHPCSDYCGLCKVPAGSAAGLVRSFNRYPAIAFGVTGTSGNGLEAEHLPYELDWQVVEDQIDDNNPIIAGISPSGVKSMSGVSEHVALIIGYRSGNLLVINDPYPFPVFDDPYLKAGATKLRPGRYEIEYDNFVENLLWQESFEIRQTAVISDGDAGDRSLPRFCCTVAGKLGPYPNTSIPAGGTCFGTTAVGQQLLGQACY